MSKKITIEKNIENRENAKYLWKMVQIISRVKPKNHSINKIKSRAGEAILDKLGIANEFNKTSESGKS